MRYRVSLPSALIRFGFFLALVIFELFVGFDGGFHRHWILRSAILFWGAMAILTYLVDGVAAWRSRAS